VPAPEPLEVRASPVHGDGVFALRRIAEGELVGSYEGRRYAPREAAGHIAQGEVIYAFGLSDGSLIEGAEGGNQTRHLNHSCAPNCEAVETRADDGQIGIEFRATRAILKGEELFIDYWLARDADDNGAYLCRCGAEQCRGTMLAPPQKRRGWRGARAP
jgi:SET domain-containing protein